MNNSQNAADMLRSISVHDFKSFGLEQIGYVRPVVVENRHGFALYGADGRLLTMQDTADMAALVARHNGLEPMMVH